MVKIIIKKFCENTIKQVKEYIFQYIVYLNIFIQYMYLFIFETE